MRTVLALFFLFFVVPVFSQDADSLTVDSLIELSQTFASRRELDKALEALVAADKIALEKFGRESVLYGSCCFNRGRVHYLRREYEQAEKWHLESRAIREKTRGKEHVEYADCQYNLALVTQNMRRYAESESLFLETKRLYEACLRDSAHPNYTSCLTNLAVLYYDTEKYEQAVSLYLIVKSILERAARTESISYAGTLINLANACNNLHRNEEAEQYLLQAKVLFEDKLKNRSHPFYANCLNTLAILYRQRGDYEKAESLYLVVLTIHENSVGKEHPAYANALRNLGIMYTFMRSYEKAEQVLLEAKGILERTLGKMHPEYAKSLGSLGGLYTSLNDFQKAESIYLETLVYFEKTVGKEQNNYAIGLGNLAVLYLEMGDYAQAERLNLEALAIEEKILGKESLEYATTLNNLALVYVEIGNYRKAEELNLEALSIREKILSKENADYAGSLNNLGSVYSHAGDLEKSLVFHQEALAIKAKTLAKEDPSYLGSLINVANLLVQTGKAEKAGPLFEEAKAGFESSKNISHPFYTNCLDGLAYMYERLGDREKVESLLLGTLKIRQDIQGPKHPNNEWALSGLADLYEDKHRFSVSDSLMSALSVLKQTRLAHATSYLSEQEMSNYIHTFQEHGDRLFTFLLARQPLPTAGRPSGTLASTAFDHALFHKGFLLTAATQARSVLAEHPEYADVYFQLKSYRRRLAAEYAKPAAEQKGVADLEEKANAAEKELARALAGYAEGTRPVRWKEVQMKLEPDAAAIEFVRFGVLARNPTDSAMYGALLLRADWESPEFVPLFEEKSLDSLLYSSGERRADYVNHLYSLAGRSATPIGKPQKTLYDLLWKPLEAHLQGVQTIHYSPSGLLHRLNLAAIPINLDSVLGDRYRLVELGSTRQLVVPATVQPAANDALLFGGIAYDADTTAMSQANAAFDSIAIASRGELSFSYTDSTLRVGTWSALPFTDREVGSVEKTLKAAGFQTSTRRGDAATEEALKSISNSHGVTSSHPVTGSPRVLHIATHGFFFPDPAADRQPSTVDREPTFKLSDHPMIRSGLLLAGANHAWQTGKPLREGMEDGILTAYEISQMNLSNTELVVLSACETGLGDIQGNEGVYGLQRAFKIAGAKYLIMSLWQVPDKQTSLLMTTFYKKWLEEKMAIPEAFREAQKELREAGLDPYQWAGFVLVE